MSKKPPDDPPKRFRIVRKDEVQKPAKPSSDAIKQIYMASGHVEWTPFSKSMGWNSKDSRDGLPIVDWIAEKKDVLAREQAETIADAVFSHRSRWHTDVLKTLKEYPEANDAMLGILKKRLNDIINDINEDESDKVKAAQMGGDFIIERRFRKVKSAELASLAGAIKVCTESKHKSLMIDDWSFKVAEQYADLKQFSADAEKILNQKWEVQIRGGESQSSQEMQAMIAKWYDKPPMPHSSSDIEKIIDAET